MKGEEASFSIEQSKIDVAARKVHLESHGETCLVSAAFNHPVTVV